MSTTHTVHVHCTIASPESLPSLYYPSHLLYFLNSLSPFLPFSLLPTSFSLSIPSILPSSTTLPFNSSFLSTLLPSPYSPSHSPFSLFFRQIIMNVFKKQRYLLICILVISVHKPHYAVEQKEQLKDYRSV